MVRGPKFSFPIPGRKSHTTAARDSDESNLSNLPPTAPLWSPRIENQGPSSYTKAERLLGTTGLPFRPSSRTHTPQPQSPAYMSVTVSEASLHSNHTDVASSMPAESGFFPLKRPDISNRPSSNALGSSYHGGDSRRGSQSSSNSRQLAAQTSNSTIRSHYDPQKSPLSISQQTSASAVRDRGLRKGNSPVAFQDDHEHVLRPSSRQTADDLKKEGRKTKPARLDLSKLFPKPRSNGTGQHMGPLLSPNKLVNSPSAMSSTSDYFPRPMTREPTPVHMAHSSNNRSRTKLTKAPKKQQGAASQSAQRSQSPVRFHERDMYDNAKINVRRPPRGIEHWFDGLGDDTDDSNDEGSITVPPAHRKTPDGYHLAPTKKGSLGGLNQAASLQAPAPYRGHGQPRGVISMQEAHGHSNHYGNQSLKSPSQFSVQSQNSLATNRTKESAFSKSNLQNSSVLSISSSEDEDEDEDGVTTGNIGNLSDSIGSVNYQGEIIIGQAQAFDIRPIPPKRRPSDSKMSMLTTSTNAATIEVMYTPEPSASHSFPRPYGSRRSSHIRQPSVIPEDEDMRPKTSTQRPMSPTTSVQSARTSQSEPRSRAENHKLMAVTEEEEALLEMMRRKRAAMAKLNFAEGYKTALSQDSGQRTPPLDTKSYRTSGFLINETPAGSPARTAKTARKSSTTTSPLLQPPPSGRSRNIPPDLSIATSILQDSSSCDERSVGRSTPSPNGVRLHQLSPPPVFSPIDLFPSDTATPTEVSIASPTTTDHASPLPSPITPGPRNGEADVDVKVAGSEPSCNGDSDEPVQVLETGVIDPPPGSIKTSVESRDEKLPQHFRRRTASSGANITAVNPVPKAPTPKTSSNFDTLTLTSRDSRDLAPVSETSSRTPSIIEPRIPRKSSRRVMNGLKLNTNASMSRNSNIYSARTSSPARGPLDRRTSKSSSLRDSVGVGSASTRCSVSEDVLAAWGSLGGWRDIEPGRVGGY